MLIIKKRVYAVIAVMETVQNLENIPGKRNHILKDWTELRDII